MDLPDETSDVNVMKKITTSYTTELIPEVLIEEQDWHASVIQKLAQPSSSVTAREFKDFVLRNGELYFRGSGGVLARAISKDEAK